MTRFHCSFNLDETNNYSCKSIVAFPSIWLVKTLPRAFSNEFAFGSSHIRAVPEKVFVCFSRKLFLVKSNCMLKMSKTYENPLSNDAAINHERCDTSDRLVVGINWVCRGAFTLYLNHDNDYYVRVKCHRLVMDSSSSTVRIAPLLHDQ